MPRMQVYLPDELYAAVKSLDLPASELLQLAVAAEIRRRQIEGETDAYLADLVAEVGEPGPTARARAEAIAAAVRSRSSVRRAV